MSIYIQGIASISPQQGELKEIKKLSNTIEYCIEPVYKEYFAPRLTRRMSRVIKMGITSAKIAMRDAEIENVDGIIVGTGLGCVKDSEKFLQNLVVNDEELLNPTAFIQSTHNTVAGQIALLLKNKGYNFTYSQSGFSFENAIFDAQMILAENADKKLLVGASDELTENLETVYHHLGCVYKNTIFGEGTSFFVLGTEYQETSYAKFLGAQMVYNPSEKELTEKLVLFLEAHNLQKEDIDMVILGSEHTHLVENIPTLPFKQFSGEYHTASAFALWLSSVILKEQSLPEGMSIKPNKLEKILIFNTFKETEHSFMLLEKC